MALLWLFSRQMPLALLPFAVYSVFHVATYTRQNLLPVLQPPPAGSGSTASSSNLANSIAHFVKTYYDTSMSLVAILEIALWFRILLSAITFQKGSWILLILYTVFFRVRHSNSSFVQSAVSQLTARADQHLANQSMHPTVRNGWEQVKNGVRKAADATDVNRLVRQNQTTPKKTS